MASLSFGKSDTGNPVSHADRLSRHGHGSLRFGGTPSRIGIGRALTLMLGYEIPYAILVLTFIGFFQQLFGFSGLTDLQAKGGLENWFGRSKMALGIYIPGLNNGFQGTLLGAGKTLPITH